MAADIPDHVQRFVTAHVDSLELIEVLLLLRRGRDRTWSPEEVSERLYTSPASASRRLQALHASRLAAPYEGGPSYRYAPGDPSLEQAVADLEHLYATRRIKVTQLVYGKPDDSLRTFADAFRLRENK